MNTAILFLNNRQFNQCETELYAMTEALEQTTGQCGDNDMYGMMLVDRLNDLTCALRKNVRRTVTKYRIVRQTLTDWEDGDLDDLVNELTTLRRLYRKSYRRLLSTSKTMKDYRRQTVSA